MDYLKRQAVLHFQIETGNPDAHATKERERKGPGTLTLTGLLYLVMEPPLGHSPEPGHFYPPEGVHSGNRV